MLYMTIFTYPPERRDEVIKRRIKKGAMIPKGMKSLGEWSDVGGGRVFRLVDVSIDDLTVMLAGTRAWSDLGKIELVPVIETEQSIKLALK
jgi:hypothetical protein